MMDELKWTDTLDIAIELFDNHEGVDPRYIRFTDLHAWVMALENFNAVSYTHLTLPTICSV